MMEAKKSFMTSQLPSPWTRLQGKVVLVTGASSGLGREFCLDLAKAGCKILAAARRTDRLNSLCQQIHNSCSTTPSTTVSSHSIEASAKVLKQSCVAVELDVTSEGSVIDTCIGRAWDVFGKIDVLVNNAGLRGSVSSPLDLQEDEWRKVLSTNITGAWLVTKNVCKRMREANLSGSVINISSAFGLNRNFSPGGVAYISSKAALNSMTQVMASELGQYSIRVNSICPGLFPSEITQNLFEKKWFAGVLEKGIPLKTFGSIDPALTSLVRYLIHSSSSYVTGNLFIVDAGCTLTGILISSSL